MSIRTPIKTKKFKAYRANSQWLFEPVGVMAEKAEFTSVNELFEVDGQRRNSKFL